MQSEINIINILNAYVLFTLRGCNYSRLPYYAQMFIIQTKGCSYSLVYKQTGHQPSVERNIIIRQLHDHCFLVFVVDKLAPAADIFLVTRKPVHN